MFQHSHHCTGTLTKLTPEDVVSENLFHFIYFALRKGCSDGPSETLSHLKLDLWSSVSHHQVLDHLSYLSPSPTVSCEVFSRGVHAFPNPIQMSN